MVHFFGIPVKHCKSCNTLEHGLKIDIYCCKNKFFLAHPNLVELVGQTRNIEPFLASSRALPSARRSPVKDEVFTLIMIIRCHNCIDRSHRFYLLISIIQHQTSNSRDRVPRRPMLLAAATAFSQRLLLGRLFDREVVGVDKVDVEVPGAIVVRLNHRSNCWRRILMIILLQKWSRKAFFID